MFVFLCSSHSCVTKLLVQPVSHVLTSDIKYLHTFQGKEEKYSHNSNISNIAIYMYLVEIHIHLNLLLSLRHPNKLRN